MAGELAKLFVTLGLDDKELQSSLKKVQATLTTTGKYMTAIGASITASLGLATKSAIDEQIGINQLSQALKNVGADYNSLSGEIESYISTTQNATNYADGEQREALAALVSVTGTYKDALAQLRIATDMAAAKNMDLVSAAELVGRTVTGDTSLLKRYGIVVKDGATATEALATIQDRFSGAAESSVNPLTQLKNSFGDLVEDIGSKLIPVIQGIVDKIKPVIQSIRDWIARNPELAKTITIIAAVIGVLFAVIGPLLLLLPMLSTAFTALLGPVGWVILAITGLITVGTLLATNWDKVVKFFKDAWQNIKIFFLTGIEKILGALAKFTGWIPGVGDAIQKLHDKVASMLEAEQLDRDAKRIKETIQNLTDTVNEEFDKQVEKIQESYDAERDAAQTAYDETVDAINKSFGEIEDEAKDSSKTRRQLAKEAAAALKESYAKEKDAARDRYDAERDEIRETYDLKLSTLDDEYNAQVAAIDAQIDAIERTAKEEDLAKTRAKEQQRLAELKYALDTAETEEDKAKALAAYGEYAAEVQENEAQRARDAQVQALEDQKTAIRTAYEESKKNIEDERDTALQALEDKYNAEIKYYDDLTVLADANLKAELARIETERLAAIQVAKDKLAAENERILAAEKAEVEHFAQQLAATNGQIAAINTAYDSLTKEYTITITTVYETQGSPPEGNGGTTTYSAIPDDTDTTGIGVKKYASGGLIPEPTLLYGLKSHRPYALAGEAGPEIVAPAVAGGGYGTANIILELDGRTLARLLGQPLVDEIRLRTGAQI